MGLEMSGGSGMKSDKSKPGGTGAAGADTLGQVLGVLLFLGLLYFVAQSSHSARTVPVESYAPDGTRIPVEGRSR